MYYKFGKPLHHGCRKTVQLICIKCMSGKPDFTKNNYKVFRGPYNSIDERHINFFRDLLGENKIIMDLSDLEKYNVDQMSQLRGKATIVLRPQTTEHVSKILAFCNQQLLAVCPQGGNTGLCGGATPVFDEIVISTELMNKIEHLDETAGVLTCQAGCVLENLSKFLERFNLMMPLDLGAKGSCQIGGNVATNAGGLRLLRYGNLQGNVLGLEVVKADGTILDCLSTLKKDNTGYHLKHLFIGSEGTLGFITKVAIQCPPKSKSINLVFMGLQKFEKVLRTFQKARHDLGEILSAVEVIDTPTMQMMKDNLNLSSPIGDYPLYLIIETSGSNDDHDQEKLNNFLEQSLNQHYILNGVVAYEPSKQQEIWALREKVVDAMVKDGYVYMYDVTLPLTHYYQMVDATREFVRNKAHRVFGFGHLGDGNLHLQVSAEKFTPELKKQLDDFVYKSVAKLRGSISAEHGIGFLKRKYLNDVKDAATVSLMKSLKKLMDPNKILNPYKVLP